MNCSIRRARSRWLDPHHEVTVYREWVDMKNGKIASCSSFAWYRLAEQLLSDERHCQVTSYKKLHVT
jgi:hypothetical protein